MSAGSADLRSQKKTFIQTIIRDALIARGIMQGGGRIFIECAARQVKQSLNLKTLEEGEIRC